MATKNRRSAPGQIRYGFEIICDAPELRDGKLAFMRQIIHDDTKRKQQAASVKMRYAS